MYSLIDIRTNADSSAIKNSIGKPAYLWNGDAFIGLVLANMNMGETVLTGVDTSDTEQQFLNNDQKYRYLILKREVFSTIFGVFGKSVSEKNIIRDISKAKKLVGKTVSIGIIDGDDYNNATWLEPEKLTAITEGDMPFMGEKKFNRGNVIVDMTGYIPKNMIFLKYRKYDFNNVSDIEHFVKNAPDGIIIQGSTNAECQLMGINAELKRIKDLRKKDSNADITINRNQLFKDVMEVIPMSRLLLEYTFKDGTPCGVAL